MKHRALPILIFSGLAFAYLSLADAQKPLGLADVLAWKRIQAPMVSNNGEWFAYRVAPAEGNAEVVVRNLKTGKEQRFPAGDAMAAGVASALALSDDARWVAFDSSPTTKEAKAMKKAKKQVTAKVVLVELATGKKVEFEKIRRFAFSGENSMVLALLRTGADGGGGAAGSEAGGAPGRGAPPGGAPAGGGGGATPDRPTGTDMLLHDLTSGDDLSVGNVADFAFDKKGNWLAWTVDAADKMGNGVELRNMNTGTVQSLDSAKASYQGLAWTEKVDGLTVLRGVEDKGFEDKLYSMVAFKDFGNSGAPAKTVYDPAADTSFPKGMSISPNRPPAWREDFSAVMFGIHEVKVKKNASKNGAPATEGEKSDAAPAGPAAAPEEPVPDLVLWHWKDPRLQPMQDVQQTQDKNFSYLAEYRPAEKKFVRLADETVKQVTLGPEAKWAAGLDIRDYELESNLDGKRFQDVYVIDPATGDRKLALKKTQHFLGASPDGTKLLHYSDGVFYAYDVATGKSTDLTSKIPATFWDTENDVNVVKPPTPTLGWVKDSSAVLISDEWDVWKVTVAGGTAVNLTVNGKKDKIRYRRRFRLDPEERGIDLSAPQYFTAYGEWTKKNGIGLIEPGKAGVRMLQWGDAAYTQLVKAKNADTYLYTRENTQEYPNYYVANAQLENGQKVSDANPQQKDFLWPSGVRIVDYTSTRGEKLQAALYLPANYDPSKKYPMVVEIYEKESQGANNYPFPGYNGFSVAYYTSNGYAALEPDIVYKVNDPGMSAVACVVPAVKAAVATGVVDAARVGLHGHSWGGYQTAFLVTQTDVFHASVAGAPLTDMISMYSLIYWNSGGTNQAIFESSQGRFSGGYWDNLEAYQRNSPVYYARNVHTPLMILHNDKDGAVDHTQGIEYFNTLRRLGKPVIMLEYKGENHGLRKPENMKDYTARMKEWFDHYLLDKPAPQWMEKGVPLLKMKDHLEERTKEINKTTEPAKTTGSGGQ